MTGRTHDLAAFTALGVLAITNPLPEMTLGTGLVAFLSSMVGGIAPDIDQPTAPLWRNLPIASPLGRVFSKAIGGHRFISHSIIGIVIFGAGWRFILSVLSPSFPKLDMNIIWWGFMIGFASHLIMDTFTREGVPWLLPLPIKFGIPPVKAFRVETGEFVEKFVIFPGLILINFYMYYTSYGKILDLFRHHLK